MKQELKENQKQKLAELKRTEEDLADLITYIKDFSDFLPLPICIINPVKIITDCNRALSELTDYQETEIIGNEAVFLFKEKQKWQILETEILKEKEIKQKELTILTKNHREIVVSVSTGLKKDKQGTITGYFLALSDVSKSKKFQEELENKVQKRTKELEASRTALMNILEDIDDARKSAEKERDKTQSIIANFTDGLLLFDATNTVSLVNSQAEKFLNLKKEDIINKSTPELNIFPTIKPIINLIGEAIKEVFRTEVQINKDLALEISAISTINAGKLLILHDITREKLIERMKTEFVALAAHQLRTPLSAIKWTLRMILDGDIGKITPEQRDFLGKTYQSNERMISLVNDLLNVARIEEGRYIYKPALSSLEEVAQGVIKSSKEELEKRQIKFEFKPPQKKLPQVFIDVEKIKLVIQNLIDNAMHYTSAGGTITIDMKCIKKEIEFSIKDTGTGIPQDQQLRVFTKFFRAANAMKKQPDGSGLGLFIAKNIVESHGGKIWFESEENKGSTFYFTLSVNEEFEKFISGF